MECFQVPELAYGEFSDRFHRQAAEKHVPISGSLELTFRCNLRCVHCYAAHGHKGIPGLKELSTQEVYGIFDQIAEAGCLWLLLTGGELLLRPDFLDIYTYAKKKGLIVTLFTNGTLLTPEIADYLAEWRPFSIEITLYGASQETYERVTGQPKAFERALRGIELLRERNLPLKLKTMLLTVNQHELDEMKALAEKLGLTFHFDPILNTRLDGVQIPYSYQLPVDEVIQFELADADRSKRWPEFFRELKGKIPPTRNAYTCSAGINAFHIDPYGQMSLCLMARAQSFDLRQGSFKEAWENFIPSVRQRQYPEDFKCVTCDLRSMCAQCPALAELETGDAESTLEFQCKLAHARAAAFNFV
jgi:radical SAM protein with 4Fe4S-binding SPASM domain